MRVFAAALVGILGVTVLALPAEAAESVGSSVTVSGPCTSAADYRVILRDEGTTGRVRLIVSNAAPGSRWPPARRGGWDWPTGSDEDSIAFEPVPSARRAKSA